MSIFNREKIKEIFYKINNSSEKIGINLTWGLLVYSIILCIITVNIDRTYIGWKLEKSLNNAFSEIGNTFTGNNINKKQKRQKFFAPKPKNISVGETIKNEDLYEIEFKKVDFTASLKPSKPNSWLINYFKPKDDNNIYAELAINVKNLEGNEIDVSNIIQNIKITYDNKYQYEGFLAMEYADGSDFEIFSYKISPLQVRKVYLLAEIPKTAKTDEKPVDISFDIAEQAYILNLKTIIK